MSKSLFVDGGVIGANPSKLGGTWSWCLVQDGVIREQDSGLISCEDLEIKTISNNYTELFAALKGIASVTTWNCRWDGTVYTDSLITLRRITNGLKFNGIPNSMRLEALHLRRFRRWKVVLIAGHPTKAELESGVARRNGNPVSKWNVFCDEECKRLAAEFMQKKGKK